MIYTPECCWWETLTKMKKFFMLFVAHICFVNHTPVAIVFVFAIVICYLLLNRKFKPARYARNGKLAFLGGMSSAFISTAAL